MINSPFLLILDLDQYPFSFATSLVAYVTGVVSPYGEPAQIAMAKKFANETGMEPMYRLFEDECAISSGEDSNEYTSIGIPTKSTPTSAQIAMIKHRVVQFINRCSSEDSDFSKFNCRSVKKIRLVEFRSRHLVGSWEIDEVG